MYPAFKINKDFGCGMLEILTSKNGYTNLAKCELKKMRCQCALVHYVMLWILVNTLLINMSDITATVIMRFGFENLFKKKVAGENFWLVR